MKYSPRAPAKSWKGSTMEMFSMMYPIMAIEIGIIP